MCGESGGAQDLEARVAQLYRRVNTGLQQDRITSVWVRLEVHAATDDEALALVRDHLHPGVDRGVTLREVRVGHPPWAAAPVIPLAPIETAGEVSV